MFVKSGMDRTQSTKKDAALKKEAVNLGVEPCYCIVPGGGGGDGLAHRSLLFCDFEITLGLRRCYPAQNESDLPRSAALERARIVTRNQQGSRLPAKPCGQ